MHSAYAVNQMSDWLLKKKDTKDIQIQLLDYNLVDSIWDSDDSNKKRPLAPSGPVRIHDLKFAGMTVEDKLLSIRQALSPGKRDEKKDTTAVASALVSCSLDEIAYIYNIRGKDVPCNTVTVAYSMISQDEAYLFIDKDKIEPDIEAHLTRAGVTILPYDEAIPFVSAYSIEDGGKRIWMDSKNTNSAIYNCLSDRCVLELRRAMTLYHDYVV